MMKKILLTTALVAVAFLGSTAQRLQPKGGRATRSVVFNVTSSPTIPQSMSFMGEMVSLDRADLYERLDFEMIHLIYNRDRMLWCMKRANRFFPMIESILKECKVPQDFIYLACTESLLDPNAYSTARAAGMWQLLAGTARDLGLEVNDEVDERYDPELSTRAACKYLKQAYAKFGHWPTVAASYNAGMGRIARELSTQQQRKAFDLYLVNETSRYVFRIMGYKLFFANPKHYGYRLMRRQLYQPYSYRVVEVKTGVPNWSTWVVQNGVTYAQLRELNPWIRTNRLTNTAGKTYKVKIPSEQSLYRSKAGNKLHDANWVID